MAQQDQPEISKDQIQSYYNQVYVQADKLGQTFILIFFFLGIGLAFFYNTYFLAVVMGGGSLAAYLTIKAISPDSQFLRYSVSLLFANFGLQYLLQMRGLSEMHFVFFIVLTILLFFEDWRILIPAILYSVLAHIFIFATQDSEWMQRYHENGTLITGTSFTIHIAMMLAYSGLCIQWSRLQREQTEEAGEREISMEKQLAMIDSNISFADEISKGNLTSDYPAKEADRLGESLLNMRTSLSEANERESKEKFMNLGLARVGDLLRQNSDSIEKLSDHILQEVVKYMKANQGAIFVIDETDEKEEILKLVAFRAWERKKFIQKIIPLGNGLAGQAAIEKRTIFMTEIPKDYVTITSGLGEATPKSILIVPLKSEEVIIGVIELASFQVFKAHEIEFLEKVGESIAATIITTKNNQQNQELLEKSKILAEQLKSQEEEMRQNMEEMQATQEEMARTQQALGQKSMELEEKQDNLNALINNTEDSIIAMDTNYKIVIMNNVLRHRYKGTAYEGLDIGADALDALGDLRDEWKEHYDRALAGEKVSFTIKSAVKGEDSFREYNINPMRNNSGTIVGLSVVSRDVTDKNKVRQEMALKGAVLSNIISHDADTYFAIDKNYKIVVVNDVLKKRYRAINVELKEGESILDALPKESLALWKSRYDQGLQGEHVRLKEERTVGDKILFLEVVIGPILDTDNKSIIGCSVSSRDITEQKKLMDELAALKAKS
jgi:PAS domain S-box-containing protein